MTAYIYDHIASGLSELDLRMIRAVPPGGNWTNIPESVPSKRLNQIRAMARERGGLVRTTYYGRLRPDEPSYTISTYFNRPGNGCNIHPYEDRTLTIREAARLQSFPDRTRFIGSQDMRRKQVGNAVPPLLAKEIGELFDPGDVVSLFAGAGGMSYGLSLAGHEIAVATDCEQTCLEVHAQLHTGTQYVVGDIDIRTTQDAIEDACSRPELVVGGPPCQGWSSAGWYKRSDPRNNLVWSFIQMLERLQPRAFVLENVQGLVWMAKGKAICAIKAAMVEVGYKVNHLVLNAADYGVPQRRKRVFIIGTRDGQLPPPPRPRFTKDVGDMFLPPYVSVEEAIGDLPSVEVGGGSERIEWKVPNDDVPYRQWCRGQIDAQTMYERLLGAHRAAIQPSS